MSKGKLRNQILDNLPEEVEEIDILREYINDVVNDIEGRVNDALDCFCFSSIEDIYRITDARDALKELSDDLY